MPSDRTRASRELPERYKAVVMQQGRVILDRDFNALQEIVDGLIAANALEAIGAGGTPDDGFAIGFAASGPPAWSALGGPGWERPDFVVGPGTMYVGGQRVVLPPPPDPGTPWSFDNQPDWVDHDPPHSAGGSYPLPRHEYVYLDVFEQEVGAVEDPDLLDVALGGPDTTQRVRLMWRVRRMTTDATDCPTALAAARLSWAASGLKLDDPTMQLRPQVTIQVSLSPGVTPSSPCEATDLGGYLGPENQLIRVQIGEDPGSGAPILLWGYDNASVLYRVQVMSPQAGMQGAPAGTTLQLLQAPVDLYHTPQPGQVVEVLRTAAVLGTGPVATGPAGPGIAERCVAEPTGYVTTVAAYGRSNNTVVLGAALDERYTKAGHSLFLRIWQGQQPIALGSMPQSITLSDPTSPQMMGIQLTLGLSPGSSPVNALPAGAYWMIAVRPSTPQAVYPLRFLEAAQPPDGPRRWICPLALIGWLGDQVFSGPTHSAPSAPATLTDCRRRFASLVALTNREWDPPLTVTNVFTQGTPPDAIYNGKLLPASELAQGLLIHLSRNIDPGKATQAACVVTVQLPYASGNPVQSGGPGVMGSIPLAVEPPVTVAYHPVVLAADVSSVPGDPSTIAWTPPSSTSWLQGLAAIWPATDFHSQWLPEPPSTYNDWSYDASGDAVFATPTPVGSVTLYATAINAYKLSPGVKRLSADVRCSGPPVIAGLLFNYSFVGQNPDFWVLGVKGLPATSGAPVIILYHFAPGSTDPTPIQGPPIPGVSQEIGFEIEQSPGPSLSFYVVLPGKARQPITFATAPGSTTVPPTSLTVPSQVGLAVFVQNASANVAFPQLAVDYGGPTPVGLLPIQNQVQLNLTVKRDFLLPLPGDGDPAARGAPTSPQPDYSLWCSLLFDGGARHAAALAFSR